MIAACPKCTARYRVDESRIGPEGAKLKCSKCEALFRVLAPAKALVDPTPVKQEAPAPVAAAPAARATSTPETPQAVDTPAPAAAHEAIDESEIDRDRLVIVADSNVEAGKATLNQLSEWGLTPILVHDGVEAMLTIQRLLPRAVVLDAGLPKMYGFQVCEVIKRNESLRHTGVILVGSIHNRDRYRRQPTELYGADHYIEQPDLPDGLGPLFKQMGIELSTRNTAATPAPAPEFMSEPAPAPKPEAVTPPPMDMPSPNFEPEAHPPSFESEIDPAASTAEAAPAPMADLDPALAEERATAERLARIIVSDIALYQPDKFAEAIRAGNPLEAMSNEIEEGRALFAQRVGEAVRAERDFIVDELIRVARERGMQ